MRGRCKIMAYPRKKKSPATNKAYRNKFHLNNNQNRQIKQIDYKRINTACLSVVQSLLLRWLPNGKVCGHEYVALNPKRHDTKLGSFKVNIYTGKWSDFATGDKGGDLIYLAAYLSGETNSKTALELAEMLGVYHG